MIIYRHVYILVCTNIYELGYTSAFICSVSWGGLKGNVVPGERNTPSLGSWLLMSLSSKRKWTTITTTTKKQTNKTQETKAKENKTPWDFLEKHQKRHARSLRDKDNSRALFSTKH